ncbi:MAG: TRAP transporter small permease [Hyphomicrobiales bacterium]|nr:TRAP transporter small permease [Hyphomicrobiales bacterium]
MFDRIHKGLFGISRVAVWCGGAALLLSAIMVTLDVTARKLFGITISGSDEISGYVFAAATTWAYSFCLLTKSNIRIDALYSRLGARSRAWLDMLGLVLLLYYVFLLTRNSWELFVENVTDSATAQTTLATPLWIPQVFWVTGLGFFLLCLIFLTIYATVCLVRKDWKTIEAIAGVKSVQEEIREETHV